MPPRAYMTLQTGKAGTLLALEAPPSAPGTPGPGFTVHRFDLQQRRADAPLNGVRVFQIAHNGEKMLYTQGQGETLRWMIGTLRPLPPAGAGGPPGPPPGDGGAKTLQTADLEVKINPRLEWPQMFRDAWRIQREMFYDPGLHGVNLADMMGRYERFLPRLSSRSDLTYLFQEMMGEMTVGHLGAGGGEQPEVRTIQTGLARRGLRGRRQPLSLPADLQRRELEPDAARAADRAGRQRRGGRVPARGRRPRRHHRQQCLQLLRGQGRQAGRAAGRTQRQRRRRAHGRRGAGAIRVGLAHVRVGRRQPAEGEPDDRRTRRLYLHARHRLRRLHQLQPLLLRAGQQERGDHRRAVQRRRHAGHRHRRNAVAKAVEPRRDARRRRRAAAAGRDLRPQGDDHQRIRRVRRRRDALVFPPGRRRAARRQAHVGRTGRARRRAGADGRRLRLLAQLGGLGSVAVEMDRRKRGHRARRRESSRIRQRCDRARIRNSRRRSRS